MSALGANEEPARMMTQKTALRSLRPKDVMMSLLSIDVESQENLCTIFYRILAKENIVYYEHPVEFSSEKLDIENFALMQKISQYVILRQELTENDLRKWRVRYEWMKHAGSSLYRSLIVSDPSVMNTLFQMVSCPHLSF
jgi:hypothetical protein